MSKKRVALYFIIITGLILLFVCVSIGLGSVRIPPAQVLKILVGEGTGEVESNIIFNIRMPRALAAILLGGALALSGYILQTFFGNPVVGPFVLGISSGAKLTVALAMIASLKLGRAMDLKTMILAAFAGSVLAMGFVLLISLRVRSMSVLVVCGIMIGYICSAITDFVVTFADDSDIVNLHNWSMGSLSGVKWDELRVILVIILFCLLISGFLVKPMSAYRLGEAYARSAGVNVILLRVMLIFISCLLAACVTAFAGPISFVGIAIPHLVRSILKTDAPHIMIPAGFLGGALVTLFCDAIARTVFAPTEVSISSVTAVLLVPVVILMLIGRSRKRVEA